MTDLDSAIDGFLWHCEFERNLSRKTLKAYGIDLHQFWCFARGQGDGPPPAEVDREVVRGHLQEMAGRYRPRTVRRKVATLKSFFTHLEFEDAIVVNPLRKMRISLREEKPLPRTIALREVRRIFRRAYGERDAPPGPASRSPAAARDVAVLEMLFATGMRVSELCGLRRSDVDLRQNAVLIRGKGGRERLVPLCGEEAKEALAEYLRRGGSDRAGEHLFANRRGRPLSEQSVRLMVRRHARRARLGRRVTPHMFRHTVATLLLGNGADIRIIQHLLGHSSIATTQIYAHVEDSACRRILRRKHPRQYLGTVAPRRKE
jgi:integrase/recombinase XerD